MDQTVSVVNISVGCWLKPAVLRKPTLSVDGSNRQCCPNHQCRFMVQSGSVGQANTVGLFLTGSDGYDNIAGLLLTGGDGLFVYYCFIIYFNLYFFVELGLALYMLCRRQSINIKHYKCYGYNLNVLI